MVFWTLRYHRVDSLIRHSILPILGPLNVKRRLLLLDFSALVLPTLLLLSSESGLEQICRAIRPQMIRAKEDGIRELPIYQIS